MAEKIQNSANTGALANVSNNEVSYQLNNGAVVVLNEQVIRNLTNNNVNITDGEIQLFIEMCKYQGLNPLTKEAYLVKIDKTKPAQQIVALGAFMRIADQSSEYEGIEDGIIVQNKNGDVIDRVGCVKYQGELLIGGWAKVYRKDRKFPFVARVDSKEYSKGQATWNALPMVMINKVAKVSALRKAFPQSFSGMYVAEEMGKEEEQIGNTMHFNESNTINQDIIYDIDIGNEDIIVVDTSVASIESPAKETADTAVVEIENVETQPIAKEKPINDKPMNDKEIDYDKIYYVTYPYYKEHIEKFEKAGEYNETTKRLPVKVKREQA